MPTQEHGTRPARALPYTIFTDSRVDHAADKFWIDMVNNGNAGAAFYVYSTKQPQENPRRYAVSASQQLTDYWPLSDLKDGCKLSVYGPNGSLSEFACDASSFSNGDAKPEIKLRHVAQTGEVHLTLRNSGTKPCTLQARNVYEAGAVHHHTIAPGKAVEDRWRVAPSAGWFDLSVTQESAPGFLRRFAGHLETGKPSTSDPGIFKDSSQ